jgi:hypothetical protein
MSEPDGGSLGGGTPRQRMKDARLVERALRERWPIPKAIRKPLVDRLNEIIQDTQSSPREVVSAARAILAASRINLESSAVAAKLRESDEIGALLAELERKVHELEQDQATPGRPRNPARNGRT